MAEATGNLPEQKDDQGGGLQLGPEAEQPKDNKKIIIAAIAAAALLLIAAAIALFILLQPEDEITEIRGTEEEAEFIEQYNQRMQFTLKPADPIFTEPFTYTVNMKNGWNYIHLSIKAVLHDPTAVEFLEFRIPLIDDKLITLLKNKIPQDFQTRTGLETLKQEIYIEFNTLFPQDFIDQSRSKDRMPVKDVLIVEFFVQ